MKKLLSRPSTVLIMGAMIAGLLLILLVQVDQPLAIDGSLPEIILRAQSNGIVLFLGVALVAAAALFGLVVYMMQSQQAQTTTGNFRVVTPSTSSPTAPKLLSSDETRSRGTRPASLPSRPKLPLAYLIGPGKQSIVIQHADFSIGRSRDNHLVVNDPHVSRHHARIVMQHGHFMLCNLSKLGTAVNAVPVHQATVLNGGEQIRIGSVDFYFTLPTSQSSSKLPVYRS